MAKYTPQAIFEIPDNTTEKYLKGI